MPISLQRQRLARRSYRALKGALNRAAFHHHVYVVLLAPEAAHLREMKIANPERNPDLPCVYVGMTGLSPEERFTNHKAGRKAARVVQLFGVKLLPELYKVYNPMPFEAALQMEKELAEELRAQGYTVAGGH